jgi:hypothetical protein
METSPLRSRRPESTRRRITAQKSIDNSCGCFNLALELEGFEVGAESGAEFGILQGKLDGGFQVTEFVARVVGNPFIDICPQAMLAREDAHGVGELNFVSRAGLRARETIENFRRQDITAGDGQIGRSVFGFGLFDKVFNTQQALAKRGLWRGLDVHNAVQICFFFRDLFHGNCTNTSGFVNVNELLGSGIFAGDEDVAEQNGERLVADEIARDEHGVAQAERLFLPRVADLDHVADAAHHFGLVFFPFFLEKTHEAGGGIEMILDGIFPSAGDDDDVLDAGSDAFFGDILNLRLIDDGDHLFRLRFGGGKKTGTEARGGKNGLADFANMGSRGVNGRRVGLGGLVVRHRLRCSQVQEG